MPLGAACFLPQDKRGVWHKKLWGVPAPHSLKSFVFRGLPLLFGFHNDDTEKSGKTIATPPRNGGGMRPRVAARCGTPLHRPPGGRYRRYLSLREGSEQTPFPSRFIVSDRSSPSRVRSAASRPGRLRSDPKDALLTRGKGGCGSGLRLTNHGKPGAFWFLIHRAAYQMGQTGHETSIEKAPDISPQVPGAPHRWLRLSFP